LKKSFVIHYNHTRFERLVARRDTFTQKQKQKTIKTVLKNYKTKMLCYGFVCPVKYQRQDQNFPTS
jgi:hypothetical protein